MKWEDHHKKINAWLKTQDHLANATRALYRKSLKRLYDYCEHVESYGVEADYLIEQYVEYLKGSGCSGTTIQRYLVITRIFLRSIGFNSKFRYRIQHSERKASKVKAAKRWFTDEEVEMCRNYVFSNNRGVDIRNQVIVGLLIDTGARCKEISRIKLNDVNLDERIVFLGDSKTEPRSVFFSDKTRDLFGELIRQRTMTTRYRLFPENVKDIILFPKPQTIKGVVDNMLIDLGLKQGADGRGPHTFRHYVATWLHYEGGMSIMDIAFLLGDTPSTIQTHYIHPTAGMLQRRVNKSMKW